MAADNDVIKQFLVSLGFQIEQTSFKKFLTALTSTDKGAKTVGASVLGIAVAAEVMVNRFASSMEKLYYVSKRTNSSVENLQALEFGSRKIGLAAGQARDALESMAAAARMNPGIRGLIDSLLGKNTANLDQSQVMLEVVQKLSSMPHYMGAQYAGLLGMDEKTFLMLKEGMPELLKAEQERREMNRNAGVDMQAAAEAGKEYANSIRDITERLGVLRDRVAIEMLPAFRSFNAVLIEGLDNLARFKMDEHPRLKATVGQVPGMADGQLKGIVDATKGAQSGDVNKLGSGLWGILKNSLGGRLIGGAFNAINEWRDSYRPGGSRSANPTPPAATPASAGGKVPLGLRQNNPGNLRSWGSTPTQNGFARFNSPADGLGAMAGNILAYYNRYGLNTVRDIIARWAPSNENNTGAYIDAISKRLGVGAGDKLNLKDPAVLAKLMGAMVQQEQGYNPFGTAELLAAANSRLGNGAAGSVVINQKTDIHVNGADSPVATGRQVALVQDETNGNLVRNMRGAVR